MQAKCECINHKARWCDGCFSNIVVWVTCACAFVCMACSLSRNNVFTTKIRFTPFKGLSENFHSVQWCVLLHVQGHRETKSCEGFESV